MGYFDQKSLVIGRGEIFFDPFAAGTFAGQGERYIGNTPAFSVSRDVISIERSRSYDGQKFKIEEPIVEERHSASFITDHISLENIALWHNGLITPAAQSLTTSISETKTVYRGRHYQLGVSSAFPTGVAGIGQIKAFKGASEIDLENNFEVDRTNGRVFVRSDAPNVADGNSIRFEYERQSGSIYVLVPRSKQLFGSLRFISRNPVGPRKSYFYPYVMLESDGSINLKGNDWQQMAFRVEARRLSPVGPYFYIYETEIEISLNEQSIIEIGEIELADFPFWDNELNSLVNTTMPSHGY